MNLNELKNTEQHRSLTFKRDAVDLEKRTVELAFSSEEPVERGFGFEVLDHAPESVRMERMKDGAPLLLDHNMSEQIGVVERASIDSDRVGRVVVRFSNSPKASEIFDDVANGIRRHVSVGYRIYNARLDERATNEGELETYRVTDWQPFEVSIVSVPADHSVGVGRSINSKSEDLPMTEEVKNEVEQEEAQPATEKREEINIDEIRANVMKDATAQEQIRVNEILSVAAEFNQFELARTFIENGASPSEFRSELLNSFKEGKPMEQQNQEIGLTDQEAQRYSIVAAVRASVTGDWSKAGFEKECSDAVAERQGKEAKGFYLPLDVLNRATPMTVGTDADGGFLKGTQHMAGNFIDNLRASSVILGNGAMILDGLVGDIAIPRKDGSAAFNWVTEDADGTDVQVTLGQVLMSPKTITGAVPMSRKLLKQSSPSVDAIVMSDLVLGAALAIDAAAINGSGAAGQPTGILNQAGVLTQTVADVTNHIPTHAELVGFETKLAAQNALNGSLRYLTTPTINGSLKTAKIDAGSGRFIVENGQANGYSVVGTTQMPANQTLFGNFNDVIVGMWGVLDIVADEATKAASGGLVLRAFQDVDIALRHAKSFCKKA